MSHYMTALAMRQAGLKPAAKIVLYWIADHHNGETGQCNPSIARLAKCCEMSRRSVEGHIEALSVAGLIQVTNKYRQEGGKSANSYSLCLGESDAQNLRMGSAKSAHGDAQNLRMKNPVIFNPVIEPTPIAPNGAIISKPVDDICETLCKWASTEAVESFIAYRRRQKGKALSLTAAKRVATQLQSIFQRGGDTDDALGMAEERGWQSVQADWYFKAKEKNDDNRNGANDYGSRPSGPGTGMARALAQVALERTAAIGGD